MYLEEIPEVVKLWHPTLNDGIDPSTISSGSHKYVWWLCPESGGSYQRTVKNQVNYRAQSPFASKKELLRGYNDLATTHPDLADIWHPDLNGDTTPNDVMSNSNVNAYWLCTETGASYDRLVLTQVKCKGRSPYTSGRRVLAGYNDLATTHPHIAEMWHPTKNGDLTPQDINCSSHAEVWWVCTDTQEPFLRIVKEHKRCKGKSPFLSGQRILVGYNDLATTHPHIAEMWHPTKNGDLTPQNVSFGSGKNVWWLCPDTGESYFRYIPSQINAGPISPYMTNQNRRVLPGHSDLATTHPDIAKLWNPTKNGDLTPDQVACGSKKKVWWLCPDTGESYDRSIYEQVDCNGRSPYTSGRRVLPGYNDLATTHPEIAALWHPTKNGDLKPEEITFGSKIKAWWVCPETGREFQRITHDATLYGVFHPAVSSGELAVLDFISSLGVNTIRSDRTIISPLELDIVVPEKKVAIEYNGVYWHSEGMGKDRNYHHNKWSSAQEAGYQLITIWEDDWRDNQEVVKSMLRRKLGVDGSPTIGARKCSVVVLTKQECATLLDHHHIQGYASGSIYLGLKTKEGDLVAASSWTKTGTDLRLDRFATSCKVPGGMGKLLRAAQQWCDNNGCDRIVTFSDHEVSDGSLYDRLGFTRESELAPDYKYVQGGVRKHKFGFRLKKFRTDPTLQYQDGLTERELAELNGLHRVWDCGKTRHVLTW